MICHKDFIKKKEVSIFCSSKLLPELAREKPLLEHFSYDIALKVLKSVKNGL
jgi:hypothetical protein